MPGTTLCDNFLLSATRALASLASPDQMEPETSADTLLLCLLKASWIRHNRSRDNATVSRAIFRRLETLRAEVQKVMTACVEEGSGESGGDGESARQIQTGHFPSMQGAEATDSAVLDSNDNGSYECTRPLPPQGHSFSSASQRESSADCTTLIKMSPCGRCHTLMLYSSLWNKKTWVSPQVYTVYSGWTKTQSHTLPHSRYTAKRTVFLWLECFFEILSTKKQQTSIFVPPD